MKKKFLGDLLAAAAAVAMLAVLIFAGRMAYHALSYRLSRQEGEATVVATEVTMAQTTPATQETLPEPTTQPETVPETTAPETEPETVPETTVPETAPPETQPEKQTIDTVPQFFQNDYPEDRYDTGTIATSGSSMTALAMVASYMTDHLYTPDEIADDLAHYCGNTYERMDYGSDLLQLSWRRATNFHDARGQLGEGKVVIALMSGNSLFGGGNHFVVWTGINDDGLVTVLDPERDNYEKYNLKDPLQSGFRDGQLVAGYSAAWIYDKTQMPQEPFVYTPEPYAATCRYGDLTLTDQELDLLAKLICAEGESESFEGQQAIAEVILNRLVTDGFPTTLYNVIYAEGQFAGTSKLYRQKPTYTQYKAIDRALNGPYVLPVEVVFFSTGAMNNKVWGRIGAHTFCYSYDYQGD